MTTEFHDINSAPTEPSSFGYLELDGVGNVASSALASEVALAISYNGINHAVMMVSPGNLEDFVTGFSITNNIISSRHEIYDIKISVSGESYHVNLEISSRAFWNLKNMRRHLTGATGCGICGVEAIEQALPKLEKMEPAPVPNATSFTGLRERIATSQCAAKSSGALHAALYIDNHDEVRICREDIGRHNALDKLIGAISRGSIDSHRGLVVITSRCSLELIHKAVRANIGTLVSLSSPTALTVNWARRYRLNLIHLPHYSPARLYSPAP